MICVLNACEGKLDMVLGEGESIACAQCWSAPTKGAELLTPALSDMLERLHLTPAHITQWAAVRGPGSFTGVRLTLSTIAAVRRITGATVAGLDYMQCLAVAGQRESQGEQGHIYVITHARRNLVHFQAFTRAENGLPQPLAPVGLISPLEAFMHMQEEAPPSSIALGSGLIRNADAFASCPSLLLLKTEYPHAADLWLAACLATYDSMDIEPLYIRPCDAVDNLNHIAQKQGRDPVLAHAKLEALLSTPPTASSD